ncbi:MAG: sigma-70 family RNA polymerase sigma factor [Hyphomicrobiales bacterium]|nr:sigma-70 family RNA polymerase sigma factor [Hyphomicrobiales bacterium]
MSGAGGHETEAGGRHDDDRLILRMAKGDQTALATIIDRHGRGLRLFAARLLGSASDAEDVVQDVFVAAWKHAARFDPAKGRASTWLYRIAANRCIDARRRRSLRAFIGLDAVADEVAGDEPDAEQRVGARQELAIARAGLKALPERQRTALLLRAVADMDVAEIAAVMETSVGSAEQLLVRGRRALRDHMAMAAKTGDNRPGSVS